MWRVENPRYFRHAQASLRAAPTAGPGPSGATNGLVHPSRRPPLRHGGVGVAVLVLLLRRTGGQDGNDGLNNLLKGSRLQPTDLCDNEVPVGREEFARSGVACPV
jgi:hypothetical protein